MTITRLEAKSYIEKYLDDLYRRALNEDLQLRKRFPDGAKDFDADEWYYEGYNQYLMKYRGILNALRGMGCTAFTECGEYEHTLSDFAVFDAECGGCLNADNEEICRYCTYKHGRKFREELWDKNRKKVKPLISHYLTESMDGEIWDESKMDLEELRQQGDEYED